MDRWGGRVTVVCGGGMKRIRWKEERKKERKGKEGENERA